MARSSARAVQPFAGQGARLAGRGDHCMDVQTGQMDPGYTLYGLERVGLASGFKYFGTHDWYRELAASLIDQQSNNGAWTEMGDMRRRFNLPNGPITSRDLEQTAYTLLFLSRGRIRF